MEVDQPKKKGSKLKNLVQKLKNNLSQKKPLASAVSTTNLKKDNRKLDTYFRKTPELPKNFAENLLNLELEIEEIDPPPIESIKKLLELYIIGVEYHEIIHSQRYLIFKNKINVLMAKPKVIEVLNQKESNGKIAKTIDSERTIVSKQEKKKMMDLHVFFSCKQSDETVEDKAKNIYDSQESNIKTMNNIIRKEMNSQEKNIMNRIEERKRAVSFIVESSPSSFTAN